MLSIDISHKVVVTAFFTSAFFSFHLFRYLYKKIHSSRSIFYMAYLLAACGWWAAWNAAEYLFTGLEIKLITANLQYLSISSIPVLWYSFGQSYAREERSGEGRDPHPLIWLIPVVTSVLVWTDTFFGLVRRDIHLTTGQSGFVSIAKDFGPWFWLHSLYSYVLIILGIVFLIKGIFVHKNKNKFQVALLIAGALFPVLANLLYVTHLFPIPDLDPTAIAFSFTGIFLLINLKRLQFLPIVSVAREKALEDLREAVFIFDQTSCLAYSNAAADRLCNLSSRNIGAHIDALGPILSQLGDMHAGEEREITIEDGTAGEQRKRDYGARASEISNKGKTIGLTLVLHDITRRAAAEEALKTSYQQLEKKIEERTKAVRESNDRLKEELEHRIRMERQLSHTALHDPLTGLPNRNLLKSRIEQAIARYQREGTAQYGILFLDIDDFKQINDNFGHNAGDAFLCEIAARLKRSVREVDTVSRLGGDEFVVLLDGVGIRLDIETAAERISDELTVPFKIGMNSIVPTASLGYLLSRPEISDAEDALRNADIAMYRAKTDGKNKRVAYTDQMLAHVQEKNRLTADLRLAIGNGQISLAFQPIVYLDGRTAGWEVLARWKHPDFGMIGPDRFIPIAEESGLIVPLGTFILLETLKQAAKLKAAAFFDQSGPDEELFFAVNVSAVQFGQADFAELVLSSIERYELPHSMLHIELTESAIIQNQDAVVSMISQLSAHGISFKLDDFGTGYSSLGYLDRIPIDTVKIDRSFIARIEENGAETQSSARIVKGIISLSHELGKTVIAEGIETATQVEILKSYGCDFGQGYFFSKPIDADALAVSLLKLQLSNQPG
ncbi:MAG: EAL domain-containing protein [Treponemataceae bacterium]